MVCHTEADYRLIAKDLIDGYVCHIELEECENRDFAWSDIAAQLEADKAMEAERAEAAEQERDRWQGKARRRMVFAIVEGVLLALIIFV